MIPARFEVLLDANVLYPFSSRDTLLRSAETRLFQVYWSDQISSEIRRNLVAKACLTADRVQRSCSMMSQAFLKARVIGYEQIIPAMTNDEKDRHVAAAAVKNGAEVLE